MKKYKFPFKTKHLQKTLNFPLFLFIFIVIIAFVSIFGARYIRSIDQQEGIGVTSVDNCDRIGVNGGSFPEEEVYQELQNAGFSWYQGLVTGSYDEDSVIRNINTAANYDINVIVRICWGSSDDWQCGFDPRGGRGREEGERYASMINNIAANVDSEFWAIAGHNEPNAGEKVDVSDERDFMTAVIRNVNDKNKVHLLSPAMDLHARDESQDAIESNEYLEQLNTKGRMSELWGIAGNSYYFDNKDDYFNKRVGRLKEWTEANGLGHLQIVITESGPWTNDLFESYKNDLQTVLSWSQIAAVLVFKPEGLHDSAEHITWEQTQELLPDCKSDSMIVSCVFGDSRYLMDPCKDKGNLGAARGLWLKPAMDSPRNGQWIAEGEWQAKIDNLPAFAFFAETAIKGTSVNDVTGYGGSMNRYTLEQIPGLKDYYIDLTQEFEGFANVKGEGGGTFAKLNFDPGMGPALFTTNYMNPMENFHIASQFLVDESIARPHEKGKQEKLAQKKKDGVATESDFFSSSEYKYSEKGYCKGATEKFNTSYELDAASGDWILMDDIKYDYNITDIIRNSNLMDSIGKNCPSAAGATAVQCKIATNLKPCNPCHEAEVENVPGDPSQGTHTNHWCDNIKYGSGGSEGDIIDGRKEIFLNCLNSQDIYVRHHTQSVAGVRLAGLGILENAYLAKNMFTQKDVCYPNRGIEMQVSSQLVDNNIECAGGMTGEVCDSNLLRNPGFEGGMRRPPQTDKPEWGGVPTYWYPFWYSGNKFGVDVKAPEYKVVYDGVADDRGANGTYALSHTPLYAQQFDSGLFQEIKLGDENGNPISVPAGATITISGRFQGNNGYTDTEDGRSDYRVSTAFKLQLGLKIGPSINELAGSCPNGQCIENFQFPVGGSDFDNYVNYSATGSHTNDNLSKPPGFMKINKTITTSSSMDTISVFLRGYNTSKDDGDQLQAFWDDVCLTIEYPGITITNISEEESPEAFPWYGPGSEGGGYCTADRRATSCSRPDPSVHPYATGSAKNYYPWLGEAVEILRYVATDDYSPFLSEIPDCPAEGPITQICYCNGRPDYFGAYLEERGVLEGGWSRKARASLNRIDDDDDDDDDDSEIEIPGCPTWNKEPYSGHPGNPGYLVTNNWCKDVISRDYPNIPDYIINHYGPTKPNSCDSGENMNRMFGTGNDYDITSQVKLEKSVCPHVESQLVTINDFLGMGRGISVHRKAEEAFRAVDNDMKSIAKSHNGPIFTFTDKNGNDYEYNFLSSGTYACRGNKNEEMFSPSPHTFGIAIDLNAGTNKNKTCNIDMPPEVVEVFVKNGFRWGGWWKDGMHFEYIAPCIINCHPYYSGRSTTPSKDFTQSFWDSMNIVVDVVNEEKGNSYCLPVEMLGAIVYQETGKISSEVMSLKGDDLLDYVYIDSYAGAQGPAQVMPSYFRTNKNKIRDLSLKILTEAGYDFDPTSYEVNPYRVVDNLVASVLHQTDSKRHELYTCNDWETKEYETLENVAYHYHGSCVFNYCTYVKQYYDEYKKR